MEQENLEELQRKLDEKKWRQSEIGHLDMSGKMEYCKDCPCQDSYFKICAIPHNERVANLQCAKADVRRRTLVIEPRFSKPKKKNASTKDKAFMKEVNKSYEEALTYALFDVTKKDLDVITNSVCFDE